MSMSMNGNPLEQPASYPNTSVKIIPSQGIMIVTQHTEIHQESIFLAMPVVLEIVKQLQKQARENGDMLEMAQRIHREKLA